MCDTGPLRRTRRTYPTCGWIKFCALTQRTPTHGDPTQQTTARSCCQILKQGASHLDGRQSGDLEHGDHDLENGRDVARRRQQQREASEEEVELRQDGRPRGRARLHGDVVNVRRQVLDDVTHLLRSHVLHLVHALPKQTHKVDESEAGGPDLLQRTSSQGRATHLEQQLQRSVAVQVREVDQSRGERLQKFRI